MASAMAATKANNRPTTKQVTAKAASRPRKASKTKAVEVVPYSSYGLIKGPLVEDTLRAFQEWDLGISKRANLARIRVSNSLGAQSQAWLKQVCTTMSRRFDPHGRDLSLVHAARTSTGQRHWRALLLWHMASSEGLLGDGLDWIWTAFERGGDQILTSQALTWLDGTPSQGHPEVSSWSEATRKRVAGGLLKAAVDFGLLQGKVRRRFTAYYLADEPLLYILLAVLASNGTTPAALKDRRWQWFRITEPELEHRLLLLHQAKVISFYRAGSVVDLRLPAETADQLVREVWS